MKKLLTLLLAVAAAISAQAATINFDFTSGYTDQQANVTVENSGVTIAFAKGTGNVPPVWLTSSTNMRVYPGNTITFSATNKITAIVITFASDDRTFTKGTSTAPTVSTGEYTESNTLGTWQGSANTITLTANGNKGHARINAIAVTIEGEAQGTVPNPVISPDGTLFSKSIEVNITCEDTDASIYYTLDESDPTAESTLYNGPFSLTETATVKAIAIKGEAKSSVVTATYTLVDGVASIAEFLALEEGTTVVFENPVIVTYPTEKHLYVKDETGAMLIWGDTGQTYEQGDVIPAGFYGTSAIYGGEPELSVFRTYNFKPATEQVEVEPTYIKVEDINTLHFAEYVTINNATIEAMGDGYWWITDDTGDGMLYTENFGVLPPEDLDQHYNVTGIVGSHYNIGTIYYLQPTKFERYIPAIWGDVNGDLLVNGADVTALYGVLLDGNEVEGEPDVNSDGVVNGTDVTVLYNILLDN
ncbi:MAG: chitobiase/beta-hexosaminidase C-terminal domain-containing protein [Muribaculaceae bacterium]|nr:chitobiase/beta-hexosaminidase C-terminal domain-containing protein [Muribaculaceae bacterium]